MGGPAPQPPASPTQRFLPSFLLSCPLPSRVVPASGKPSDSIESAKTMSRKNPCSSRGGASFAPDAPKMVLRCAGEATLRGGVRRLRRHPRDWSAPGRGKQLGHWCGVTPGRVGTKTKRYRTPLGSQLADFLGTASGFLGSGVWDRERVKPDPSGDDRLCLVLRVAMPQRRACGFSDGVLTNMTCNATLYPFMASIAAP